jgi:sugar O-acyltransferase (sialic acid O-acetyltransferase NeuD family)
MKILLIGASGHAKVIIDVLERAEQHEIVGLIAEDPPTDPTFSCYPILGRLDDLVRLSVEHSVESLVAAVGDNFSRSEVIRRASELAPTVGFVSCIHPSAQIARCAEIGEGTVIMAGAIVNSGTHVGRHCIINTGACVDHDCVLGDFVSIAPGAILGGNVRVGDCSAVSLGASVIHGISIGADAVVGAGAVVVRNVESNVVVYGTPARVVRPRVKGQRYL